MLKNNQKGFTIIELLVVIVIIGILIALALPNLFAAQARGRDSDRKNELKNLKQKLETHYSDNNAYPTTEEGLDALDPAPTDEEKTDPKGAPYGYTSDGESYTLTANLENSKDPDSTDGTYTIESVNQ